MYRSYWSHKWQSDFVYCIYQVYCVMLLYQCQGPVVPRAPCQMDRDSTPAPLLRVLSLTPVTQVTGWLQVVLSEYAVQMVSGQGVIQLVHVSPHFTVISYPLHTNYNACRTWQLSLHNGEPWGFGTFVCISMATHVTVCGVHMITMQRCMRLGSMQGLVGTEATCFMSKHSKK